MTPRPPSDRKQDAPEAFELDVWVHLKALDNAILRLLAKRMAQALLLDQDGVIEAASDKQRPPA